MHGSSRHHEDEEDEDQATQPAKSTQSDIILYDIEPCIKWMSETVFKKVGAFEFNLDRWLLILIPWQHVFFQGPKRLPQVPTASEREFK